jgi:hypothetical protein
MKRPAAILVFFSIEALLAFLWMFLTPSESGSPVFLWLSAQRLILVALAFGVFAILLAFSLYAHASSAISTAVARALDRSCLDEGRLGSILLPLSIGPILIALGVWQVLATPLQYARYGAWAPDTFPLLHAVVLAILPLLCLLILVSLEAAGYLGHRYRTVLTIRASWSWSRMAPALIWLLIASLLLLHWIILAFRLRTFVNIPAWYWKIEGVPFSRGDAAFAAGFLVLFSLIFVVLIRKQKAIPGLALVALLGLLLQVGVGMMGDRGLTNLAERYFSTYHKAYVTQAANSQASILEGVRRYEEIYAVHAFTSTKPPGLMAFYVGLDHLVNGHPSAYSDEVRYERLLRAITVGSPLLALLMVPLLYFFARRFLQSSDEFVAPIAPLLYFLAPSAVLFTLFPDQAIYPVVFLLGVWLTVLAIRKGSLPSGFMLGALLYLLVFFAFTMLPLYPFAGIYLVLHRLKARSAEGWGPPVRLAAAIGIGTVVLYVIFRVFLNYDFFPRFERTMAINHNFDFYLRVGQPTPTSPETLGIRLGQIVNAAWINNLDYAAAIGFPIYLLFLAQSIRRGWRFFKQNLSRGDVLLISLLLSFVLLNLLGTAQGEVPRLWLFWLPMVSLFAAYELQPTARSRPWVLYFLGLAQFVTLVLTFHFQDLRM